MYCKYCGKEITGDSKFCNHCGKSQYNEKSTNIMESIKRFYTSNKKLVSYTLCIILGAIVVYVWYSNSPSNKIVGEQQREVRGGTDIEIFKSDGTSKSITKFPGDHRNNRTNGTWEMYKGKTLVKTFWYNDEGRYLSDTYEVVSISSSELVFKHKNDNRERHFQRKQQSLSFL